VNGASWQSRTAVALLVGAGGEGACVLLARYVAGGFVLVTFVVAIAVGWRFGPLFGGIGAGLPPLGLVFVSSGHDDHIGERISAALAVILLLGGSAWITGRVRERYGKPPWGHSTGVSE
jgi:hypothetical protein